MGLWDKLKQIIFQSPDSKTFDKEKYNQKNQRVIADFSKSFDLNSAVGINSITISDYKKWLKRAAGVPSYPEQILRKKATEHKRNGKIDLAIECLKKSNEFLPYSDSSYTNKDYERLIDYLYQAGRFDEAKFEKSKIEKMFLNNSRIENRLQLQIKKAVEFGTDLLIMSEIACTCEECAKYQGRVFSISGKSTTFPKLPDNFIKNDGVHEGCRHTFSLFYNGISTSPHGDIVAYSNRPFIDNRTKQQKEDWERETSEKSSYTFDKENYYWCMEYLGALCPKSFSGYRRMKSTNSANFQKLKNAAKEKGKEI